MNTDRQQIIAKIKKLLAKADDNRGNFNECKLAMSIAMRLMAQYKIEQAELKDMPAEAQKVAERSFKTTKHAREIPYITTIMRDHFQADMAYSNYTAYVYATEDSVDNALYIAEFLYNNMKAALRAEKRKARERFRLVCEPDFYCGFMSGICSALKKRENGNLRRKRVLRYHLPNRTRPCRRIPATRSKAKRGTHPQPPKRLRIL